MQYMRSSGGFPGGSSLHRDKALGGRGFGKSMCPAVRRWRCSFPSREVLLCNVELEQGKLNGGSVDAMKKVGVVV